jgi:hypothetical protein
MVSVHSVLTGVKGSIFDSVSVPGPISDRQYEQNWGFLEKEEIPPVDSSISSALDCPL